jgi:hypothetical protein
MIGSRIVTQLSAVDREALRSLLRAWPPRRASSVAGSVGE